MLWRFFLLWYMFADVGSKDFQEPSDEEAEEVYVGRMRSADMDDFPFMVSLQMLDGEHICSGTILNKHWVLTAAHCLFINKTVDQLRDPKQLTVVAGSVALTMEDNPRCSQLLGVDRIYTHTRYSGKLMTNNIGLIKVKTAFKLCTQVAIVELTNAGSDTYLIPGVRCTVVGWVNVEEDFKLNEVEVDIAPLENCQSKYSEIIVPDDITLCGLWPINPCKIDTGGPMLYLGKQVGILSWGKECEGPKYPLVFTNVEMYLGWIDSVIGNYKTTKKKTRGEAPSSNCPSYTILVVAVNAIYQLTISPL